MRTCLDEETTRRHICIDCSDRRKVWSEWRCWRHVDLLAVEEDI